MHRFLVIAQMAAKQKLRDRIALWLSLLTAPLFVVFYWALFHDTSRTYHVFIYDAHHVTGENTDHIRHLESALKQLAETQGGYAFTFKHIESESKGIDGLKKHSGDILITYDSALLPDRQTSSTEMTPTVGFTGDVSSPSFQFCVALIKSTIAAYVSTATGSHLPVQFRTDALGVSGKKTAFESYVPGLLVFAVIMLIFSSAMSVVREIESGTFARLQMSPVTTFELVGGASLVQLITGIVSVLCTIVTAALLGFQAEGSILLSVIIAAIACAASVGIGMVVAALSKTQGRAFLISRVVMFLLVLFSGIIFPRPGITLFTIWEHSVDLFDILPTTHLGNALNRVLTLGATASDVLFEIIVLIAIAGFNYLIGSLLFIRSGKPATTTWEGML
jgi:ABC-2 type transport system permease protein